ncbi:MAG TPA: endonuclease/exonuclease/phosphatase family protein [Anaerolineae bacterium]|nr:endonuclease/exonuclease/phosphatase family protein [Anaerolineae bacterium]
MKIFNLTVATLNLNSRRDRWRERRRLVVSQLVAVQPALVALQEVNLWRRQGRWVRERVNYELSGRIDQPYQLVRVRHPQLLKGEGVAIMTQLPLQTFDMVDLGYGRKALRVNVELPDGQGVDFVTVDLRPYVHDHEARLEQVLQLIGWLQDFSRVPLQVVAGSFNEMPGQLAIKQMKLSYRSAYEVAHRREPWATYPTVLVPSERETGVCLDYLFISPGVAAVNGARLIGQEPADYDNRLYASDHVGLWAALGIEPRRQEVVVPRRPDEFFY